MTQVRPAAVQIPADHPADRMLTAGVPHIGRSAKQMTMASRF
jgi:hypothetical protein